MDILEVVQNHLYSCIINMKSKDAVESHTLNKPPSLDDLYLPRILHLRYTDSSTGSKCTYRCCQARGWIYMCQFLYDIVSEGLISLDGESLIVDILIPTSEEQLNILNSYILSTWSPEWNIKDERVRLFTLNIRTQMRGTAYYWLKQFIQKEHAVQIANSPVSQENICGDRLKQLERTVELSNYLGCESFSICIFLFFYAFTCSISCEEREKYFGHRYFMLPIEGWDSPLRQIYQISFLTEDSISDAIDEKHKEISSLFFSYL